MLTTCLTTLILLVSVMCLLWLIGTLRRDVSLVDPFWGTGFIIVAAVAAWQNLPLTARGHLLITLVGVWGLRLSLYLLWRNWGHGEDRRYAAMRQHHGVRFWWVSLLTVFVLQALILWFVSLPVQVALVHKSAEPLGLIDLTGTIIWGVGLFFEAVGDGQMARFQADPANAGRVMDRGLWRYTRHPNYFGDFCVWWGLYLVGFAGGAGSTILSPLIMSILLLKVSGVSLLESTITDRRPEYAAYKQRTSSFFPRPPRRG
ncbi:MAG: DUF1295 domain-containing protein [Planctomycetes bacterium]|nr:DUF1295 domain-containing protein [Planctomycetota bacterium]